MHGMAEEKTRAGLPSRLSVRPGNFLLLKAKTEAYLEELEHDCLEIWYICV